MKTYENKTENYITEENYNDLALDMFTVISRINMLSYSLPDHLIEEMDNAKVDLISVIKKLGFNITISDISKYIEIDLKTLYDELTNISNTIGVFTLNLPNYTSLEDAACSISLVMKGLTDIDSTLKPHTLERIKK